MVQVIKILKNQQFLNVLLRSISLVSKFLLIFSIGFYLSPFQVGTYGLLSVTVSYAIYLVGIDFYVFSTREFLKTEKDNWGRFLKSHILLSVILYLIFSPLISLVFYYEFLPIKYIPLFFAILIMEHVNQELSRILIILNKQVWASICLFFRQGLWVLLLCSMMYINPYFRSLEMVLVFWFLGGIISVVLGCFVISSKGIRGWSKKIDLDFIVQGIKVSIPFLIATLSLRFIFTIDRYLFSELTSVETLAAYTVFFGICNALIAFLEAGVFSFNFPELIVSWNRQDFESFNKSLMQITKQTILIVVSFCIVSILTIEPVITLLNKQVYLKHLHIFYWLLGANVFFVLSMVPHYALYAQGKDSEIIFSHVFSLILFVSFNLIFSGILGGNSVLVGLNITFMFLLTCKVWIFYNSYKIDNRKFL